MLAGRRERRIGDRRDGRARSTARRRSRRTSRRRTRARSPSMSAARRTRPDSARRLLVGVARRQSREARQRRHRVVHLRERAMRPDVLHVPDEIRREMHRIDQAEQRALADRRPTRRRERRSARRSSSVTPVGRLVGRRRFAPRRRRCESRRRRTARLRPARRASAPGPPPTNHPVATGCPSPAPSSSRMAALPADHGPRNDPAMPPAATVARSGSLSNHSPTRSATAIGIQRSSRYASALPSARNCAAGLAAARSDPRRSGRRATAAPSRRRGAGRRRWRAKLARNRG